MSTVKNPTFDLTQIQVVPFKCNHFFYLKPQGHQIWAYPKIVRFLLIFSILSNLIGFMFLFNNVGIHFVFTYYFLMHLF